MNIFVYSDESGVFDREHNYCFVYGGLVFLSKEERDEWSRRYIAAERIIRENEKIAADKEVKATSISNKSKSKLYRSLNNAEKFGYVVNQKKLLVATYANKKTKQRYLDWAYKMAVKTKLESMVKRGLINPKEVDNIYFYVDQHTTATNGRYELRESLEQEFKIGTFNYSWSLFHPPLFPDMKDVYLEYCDSKSKTLVRAADIVANKVYHQAIHNSHKSLIAPNFTIADHPI